MASWVDKTESTFVQDSRILGGGYSWYRIDGKLVLLRRTERVGVAE